MGEVGPAWDDPSVFRLPVPFERVYEQEPPRRSRTPPTRDLPRRQAQAVAIYHLESCSTQAVAAVLGVTHDIAHAHMEAGRQTLGRQLGLDLEEAQ